LGVGGVHLIIKTTDVCPSKELEQINELLRDWAPRFFIDVA